MLLHWIVPEGRTDGAINTLDPTEQVQVSYGTVQYQVPGTSGFSSITVLFTGLSYKCTTVLLSKYNRCCTCLVGLNWLFGFCTRATPSRKRVIVHWRRFSWVLCTLYQIRGMVHRFWIYNVRCRCSWLNEVGYTTNTTIVPSYFLEINSESCPFLLRPGSS